MCKIKSFTAHKNVFTSYENYKCLILHQRQQGPSGSTGLASEGIFLDVADIAREACANNAFKSAGRSLNIIVLLLLPISPYMVT
mmetsp:Transcript_50125/g.58521  ORF Transcript_50125/g.58521 Transcript_50125/m.58521 type:complete len:84 (-) Transcript_50125:1068-1319(-)